jgi:DDE family transposase
MIISPRLSQFKSLVGKWDGKSVIGQHLMMMLVGILTHRGRMSAQQAGSAIASNSRHRGTVGRFLKRHGEHLPWLSYQGARRLLELVDARGRYVFIVDTTNVGHQGEKTPNTYSTGNRRRRPAKGRRYSKYRRATRSCHAFVWGLLLTPDGRRIPSLRCYYTRSYCQKHKRVHRTQADLAAELIRDLHVAACAEVIVLGDTAFESRQLRAACDEQGFNWILPANPERVLAGDKPRPKLWSLTKTFRSEMFAPLRLQPNQGPLVAMRRLSPSRRGSKTTPRTFYVHEERRAVHSIGEVRILFSTKHQPQAGKPLKRDETKILLCNAQHLSVAEIVELYLLRWQIELFFKELKSDLGMHQYRFRDFRCVEAWMQIYCLAFLYLEWIRAKHVQGAKTSRARKWWHGQRTHGLSLVVSQQLAEADLIALARHTATTTGTKKLRNLLRNALATESRIAA